MALDIISYKPDQGRHARMIVFSALVVLAWYGASTLDGFLTWGWARSSLGMTIPVVNVVVTPAFLIAVVFFIGSFIGLRIAINHPRVAELLIDTEGEVRRVTWPSWQETLNGSLVVVITVISLLVVLAGADLILSRFFERVVF